MDGHPLLVYSLELLLYFVLCIFYTIVFLLYNNEALAVS